MTLFLISNHAAWWKRSSGRPFLMQMGQTLRVTFSGIVYPATCTNRQYTGAGYMSCPNPNGTYDIPLRCGTGGTNGTAGYWKYSGSSGGQPFRQQVADTGWCTAYAWPGCMGAQNPMGLYVEASLKGVSLMVYTLTGQAPLLLFQSKGWPTCQGYTAAPGYDGLVLPNYYTTQNDSQGYGLRGYNGTATLSLLC